MSKQLRRRSAVRSAAHKHVESLEQRRLLTTLIGPDTDPSLFPGAIVASTDEPFEFVDGNDQIVRIVLSGDVAAEFVGLEIHPGDEANGIPAGLQTVVDLRSTELFVDGELPDGVFGAHIFKIYIAQAAPGSYISIAEVPDVDADVRPMQPFGSPSIVMRTRDVGPNPPDPLREVDFAENAGTVYIGALTIDTVEDTEADEDRPIIAVEFNQGLGIMPTPNGGVLVAGIETASGVNIGSILVGGIITGKVFIDGSIDTFYAGHVFTGYAGSQRKASAPAILDNFHVTGDMRNFVSLGSVGTDDVPGSNPGDTRYNTGFALRVDGRLGQVRTNGSFYGSINVAGNKVQGVWNEDSAIAEIETRLRAPFDSGSDESAFENGIIGGTAFIADLYNDTFDQPQYLAPFWDSTIGRDVTRVLGSLHDSTQVNDHADYYGLPLLAGQTVEIDLDFVTQWSLADIANAPEFPSEPPRELQQSPFVVGVFDPDGRLVQTDRFHFAGRYSGFEDVVAGMENKSFRITADKPGVWRVAVGYLDDRTFNGPTDDDDVPASFGLNQYLLTIRDSVGVSMGGLFAQGSILLDQSRLKPLVPESADPDDPISAIFSDVIGDGFVLPNPRTIRISTINVDTGDVGAIVSSGTLAMSQFSIDIDTSRIWINEGNLRAVVANSIGRLELNPNALTFGPHFGVPRGSIGLIRSTGTAAGDMLYLNDSDANPNTGFVRDGIQNEAGSQPVRRSRNAGVGFDVQVVESGTNIAGNVLANRGIGIIRANRLVGEEAGFRMPVPYFVADSDRRGESGFIGLIDVVGNVGNFRTGGPAIDAGVGGNVMYMRVGGDLYKDFFFGTGGPENIQASPNASVTLIDDSGTSFTLTPVPTVTATITNPFGANPTVLGTLSYRAYPIRSGSGAAAGRVLVDVTSTTGLRVSVGSTVSAAGVHIGTVTANGVGRAVIEQASPGLGDPLILPPVLSPGVNQLVVEFNGSVPVGAYNIVGGDFTRIQNNTTAEIVNVDANGIGTLIGERIGLAPVVNGIALLQTTNRSAAFEAAVGQYPFTDQRTSINVATSIVSASSRRGLGNFIVNASIGTITPNSDGVNVANEVEGINAPIYAGGTMHTINIGEGLAHSGGGEVALSGLFAGGPILSVAGSGRGVDIRGNIVSNTRIGTISLANGGSIIASRIMVISDFADSSLYLQSPAIITDLVNNPDAVQTTRLELIRTSGVGGIMGTTIAVANIGRIESLGGFGIVTSSIRTQSTTIDTIIAEGLGIRGTNIDAGIRLNNLILPGTGQRLRTTNFTESVRTQFLATPDSEGRVYDPFLNTVASHQTDLHLYMRTDEDDEGTRKRFAPLGRSNAGILADTEVVGSRNLNLLQAWQLLSRPFYLEWIPFTPTVDSKQFEFANEEFPVRISFADRIEVMRIGSSSVGATINSGSNTLTDIAGTVERSSFGFSGRVRDFRVGGNFRGTSKLQVNGPEASLDRVSIGGFVNGTVEVALGIGQATIGGDYGSTLFYSGRTIDNITIGGNFITGSYLRGRDRISNITISGNFETDSTIRSRRFGNVTIGGADNGTRIVG